MADDKFLQEAQSIVEDNSSLSNQLKKNSDSDGTSAEPEAPVPTSSTATVAAPTVSSPGATAQDISPS